MKNGKGRKNTPLNLAWGPRGLNPALKVASVYRDGIVSLKLLLACIPLLDDCCKVGMGIVNVFSKKR